MRSRPPEAVRSAAIATRSNPSTVHDAASTRRHARFAALVYDERRTRQTNSTNHLSNDIWRSITDRPCQVTISPEHCEFRAKHILVPAWRGSWDPDKALARSAAYELTRASTPVPYQDSEKLLLKLQLLGYPNRCAIDAEGIESIQ